MEHPEHGDDSPKKEKPTLIRIRFSMCHVQNHQDLVDQHTKVLLTCDWAQLCQRDSSKAPAPKSLLVTKWAANSSKIVFLLVNDWAAERSPHHQLAGAESNPRVQNQFWDLLSSQPAAQLPRSALRCAYQSPASPLLAPTVADRLTEGGRVFSVSLRWLENTCNHSKLKDSLKMCICYLYTIDWMR